MDLYKTHAKGPVPTGSSGRDCSEAKSCADCRTTTTPLWRGGPSGPKSLCNACGIRYRKKRRGALGLKDGEGGGGGDGRKRERKIGSRSRDLHVELGMLGSGRDVMPKERPLFTKQRKLREEEEAAVLLMALSSGLLYA